jgi:stearoyl-CoA desaturase (delta-9 desaturase)
MPALVWGRGISTVILWHTTFSINSLAHVFGTRRYPTTDTSRNNLILALLTAGEGWHNNHHYFCSSARLGFHWYQVDPTWWMIVALEKLGLVWDVQRPSQRVLDA